MKHTLRKQVLLRRKAMAESEVLKKSQQVKRLLFSSPLYQTAQTILFYVSYDNEVRTHEMIQESLRNGKTVLVPKVNTKNKTCTLSKLSSWEDLSLGAYSILEPRDDCAQEITASSVNLFIIPGVVFDLHGNRIGHGFGYYDRLLQKKNAANTLGLAFELQIVERIPAEKHDVMVETIVTEDRIIRCKEFR
ncbi:MAG TPA: 5-formyltetrahydrofolate cyclo-ligase [Thermoplasmata archaeon]|nr:MAG TPA: 5-formyltetrahydrofolate cyclo-ligase [Thermoplasmata archaeon]